MRRAALAMLAALFLLLSSRQALADAGDAAQGPIRLDNQYPYAMLHAALSPRAARNLSSGEGRAGASLSWSNTENYEDLYVVDVETRVGTFSLDYGVTEALQLGASMPLVWRGAGSLDSIIDSWHRFFSLPRGDRKNFPDDEFNWYSVDGDGESSTFSKTGTSWGSLRLDAQYQLHDDGRRAWSLYGAMSLPTAADTYGQDGIDLTGGLLGQWCGEDWCLYGGAALLHYFNPDINNTSYLRDHVEGFFTAEYPWTRSVALTVGLYSSSKLLGDVPNHPSYALYLDTGMSVRVLERGSLQLLLRENPDPKSGTTDVTFYLGWQQEFGCGA